MTWEDALYLNLGMVIMIILGLLDFFDKKELTKGLFKIVAFLSVIFLFTACVMLWIHSLKILFQGW